jgi:hypothetical protein
MRTKTEYVVETVNGKSTPRKIGMAPIQRADVEYEFDIYADMDIDNTMIIQKSRCSALYGQVIAKPDGSLADVIQTWLAGTPAPTPSVHSDEQASDQVDNSQVQSNEHKPARTASTVQAFFAKQYQVKSVDLDTRWDAFKKHVLGETIADDDLTESQLNQLNGYISRDWQERQSQRSVRKVS